MNGQRWPNSNSVKTCSMCFAKKQVGLYGDSNQKNYILYENPNESMSSYL